MPNISVRGQRQRPQHENSSSTSSQVPARVDLPRLHERPVEPHDDALAHRTLRREHVLELAPHPLRACRVLLARVALRPAPAPKPDARDPPRGRRDEVRERVGDDEVAQAVARREDVAAQRVRPA